jgi:hypothetical protein
MRGSPEPETPKISDLTGKYLLVALKKGAELNREMVVSPQGREWLGDAVTIAIPASITNSLGGQLRIGDTIDLLSVPKTTTQGTAIQVTPFVASNNYQNPSGPLGIRIFSDPTIGPSLSFWNQQNYHRTNITNSVGTIPVIEQPSWLTTSPARNTYRVQQWP